VSIGFHSAHIAGFAVHVQADVQQRPQRRQAEVAVQQGLDVFLVEQFAAVRIVLPRSRDGPEVGEAEFEQRLGTLALGHDDFFLG
jgi:hypothetical protein